MRSVVSLEDIYDGLTYITVEGVRINISRSYIGDELFFEWEKRPEAVEKVPEKPAPRPEPSYYGTAECYCCGKSFKWGHTPGAIPTCDRCMAMMYDGSS